MVRVRVSLQEINVSQCEVPTNDENKLVCVCFRFQVEYVLSEPCESWTGRKGRVDESMLQEFLSKPDGSKCYGCVCGPTAFTELTIGCVM